MRVLTRSVAVLFWCVISISVVGCVYIEPEPSGTDSIATVDNTRWQDETPTEEEAPPSTEDALTPDFETPPGDDTEDDDTSPVAETPAPQEDPTVDDPTTDDNPTNEEPTNSDVLCDDSCVFAADGECDDGGMGSLDALCVIGTDCTDCGPRTIGGGTPNPTTGEDGDCNNTCDYPSDGTCDDGGPGSDYALCALGSDCDDCGSRAGDSDPVDPDPDPDPDPGPTAGCSNTCEYASDGDCDDGGPFSDYSYCALGTDCDDCGPRSDDDGPVDPGLCTNTCTYASDGDCDDGGPFSDYSLCDLGTDCDDCGSRVDDGSDPGGGLCTNTCTYSSDGDCDDGGVGSDYSLCDLGTDCDDCGER